MYLNARTWLGRMAIIPVAILSLDPIGRVEIQDAVTPARPAVRGPFPWYDLVLSTFLNRFIEVLSIDSIGGFFTAEMLNFVSRRKMNWSFRQAVKCAAGIPLLCKLVSVQEFRISFQGGETSQCCRCSGGNAVVKIASHEEVATWLEDADLLHVLCIFFRHSEVI